MDEKQKWETPKVIDLGLNETESGSVSSFAESQLTPHSHLGSS